ncbi:MAG: helix-turn-helix domain-containing protein [Archaeoglobus sp.]|uniref:helix-turn-helix domain-containing protein n=1 Tax=Archaeoglobus sp. TaxID=1872626 RepID=UPI001D7A6640|nr:helix-turn-helix domain-containing protein [Archaeoglobus sp.]MBO8180045.1 helix-turn-helix domain-containing protein [Archaeoglobus sp.]
MEFRSVAERICGDIVLSEDTGEALRKWRGIFNATQSELAKKIGISPSVISDYESGRRRPGTVFLKKFITALIELDGERGYQVLSKYRYFIESDQSAILDIAEYQKSAEVREFCEVVEGKMLTDFERVIHGHTAIDSINAILSLNAFDFYRLYGLTSERALIFTRVSTGRSPMVAVRVSNLKPSAIVLHGLDANDVDGMAVKIAEIERIPLIVTGMEVKEMIKRLRRKFA